MCLAHHWSILSVGLCVFMNKNSPKLENTSGEGSCAVDVPAAS